MKLMVPRLLFDEPPDPRQREFLMLGLGDMALPGVEPPPPHAPTSPPRPLLHGAARCGAPPTARAH